MPPRDDTKVAKSRLINTCVITYAVSKQHQRKFGDSLVDRVANGGLAGKDMRVISTSAHRSVHVEGIDNHQVRDVPIVNAGGVINTTKGARNFYLKQQTTNSSWYNIARNMYC